MKYFFENFKVCRQCFNTCDPDDTTNDGGSFCFGGSHVKAQHKSLAINLFSNEGIQTFFITINIASHNSDTDNTNGENFTIWGREGFQKIH